MSRPTPDAAFAATLLQAQGGDEDAFALLWRAHNPSLLRYLGVLCPAVADDIAAETWLQVVRGLGKFRGDETGFRSWLFTIARNKVTDWQRQQKRRPATALHETDAEAVPADDDTADAALRRLDTEAALALIAQLPRDQAEIVLLRVVAGFDVADVAKLVGRQPGTVRVTAHRALKRLQ